MLEGSASVPRNSDFGTRYLEKPLLKYNGGGIKHIHTKLPFKHQEKQTDEKGKSSL